MDSQWLLLDVLAFITIAWLIQRLKAKQLDLPLPPGPTGLPLIGNTLSIPKSFAWTKYHEWCQEFKTDVLYLNVMGQHMIILDSQQAANELLDKRSAKYSSRPHARFVIDVMKLDYMTVLLKYGETWRQHRRLAHSYFGANSSENYRPHVLRAARALLLRLLDNPRPVQTELHDMAGDAIMATCYGIDVRTEEGIRNLETVHKGNEVVVQALQPGRFLVDFVPSLQYVPEWVPGAGFVKTAREYGRIIQQMIKMPFEGTKRKMSSGTCPPCFVSSALKTIKSKKNPEQFEEIVQGVAGTLYGAGSDTTSNSLASGILALLGRPDVFQRARTELDRVVQPGRLPHFDDGPALPYLTAIVKEILRWKDVTPLGVAHYIDMEDDYNGYRIPAGSIVFANQWAMLHDDVSYPDPFTFRPERFMDGDNFNKEVNDPESICWGFGRRICAGRHMAFSSIWLTFASLIYAFDIEKEVDENGCVIEPNPAYTSTIVFGPEAFPCRITPRSEEFAALIRRDGGQDF